MPTQFKIAPHAIEMVPTSAESDSDFLAESMLTLYRMMSAEMLVFRQELHDNHHQGLETCSCSQSTLHDGMNKVFAHLEAKGELSRRLARLLRKVS